MISFSDYYNDFIKSLSWFERNYILVYSRHYTVFFFSPVKRNFKGEMTLFHSQSRLEKGLSPPDEKWKRYALPLSFQGVGE
jgi:hypothetical protein